MLFKAQNDVHVRSGRRSVHNLIGLNLFRDTAGKELTDPCYSDRSVSSLRSGCKCFRRPLKFNGLHVIAELKLSPMIPDYCSSAS
jgi:hypothetical protein